MNRRQRSAVADAVLAAGATIILLQSTTGGRFGWAGLAAGILLVVAGAALLWGTPRPTLRSRMLASVAGLLVGFGAATMGSAAGAWLALACGLALLLGVLRAVRRVR